MAEYTSLVNHREEACRSEICLHEKLGTTFVFVVVRLVTRLLLQYITDSRSSALPAAFTPPVAFVYTIEWHRVCVIRGVSIIRSPSSTFSGFGPTQR